MKTTRAWLLGLLAAGAASGSVWAQQGAAVVDLEIRGTVRLWAPAAQRMEVDGKPYAVARDVQVLDRKTRLLPAHRVKPGMPVLLVVSAGQVVTHVVVAPGPDSPFDKVGP